VHVAHFEAGSLSVQTARAQRRQTPLVRQHGQRVGLVDHLRQLAATEEVLDGRRDALRIDQAARRHVLASFRLIRSCTVRRSFRKALAQLVAGQLVDRPQTPVAQVVDVVDLGTRPFANNRAGT
jgi:hypothetical protein